MRCPFCASPVSKVVDKRPVTLTGEIRRRRECLKCERRFTTYERLGNVELLVIKKDGRREIFNKEKIKAGIVKALEKRSGAGKVDELVEKIERKIRRRRSQEIPSQLIGKMVLLELKKLDSIAYLRFASVYRRFENPEDFAKELQGLN